jgi:adenylate cyclase
MINRIRLISGLVLFAFVFSHFANHALGLISLEVMEAGRRIFVILWRGLPGTALLYGALAVHFALGLYALYRRRDLRMPVMEAGQLVLGLAAVPLLAEHVLGTRLLHEVANVNDSYAYVVLVLWKLAPGKGVLQAVALLVVWSHAVIGLGYWLRLKPVFPRLLPWLAAVVVLIPVLALLGFVSAGREIAVRARDAGWLIDAKARINWPQEGAVALVHDLQEAVWLGVAAALAAVLAARAAKALWERRRGMVVITYPGPIEVRVRHGTSVLESSRLEGIPHASVCGGRGRCSTCRVRVGEGFDAVTPPREEERRVLERVGAAPDMRLACQLRPENSISVTPVAHRGHRRCLRPWRRCPRP